MVNFSPDYVEQLAKLYRLNRAKKMHLSLEQPHALHRAVGSPAERFKSIHVAGTNGKGSVCYKLAAALQAKGDRVGLYSSPHVATYRERMRINGEMIAEEAVAAGLHSLFATNVAATFFEISTILAFDYFAKNKVDWVVVETGLGGRLDATNIITPQISVITSIGYDHCQYLGDTLEQIAKEKAGIIKKGVPLVVGPTVPLAHMPQGTEIYQVSGTFANYELENQAIAAKVLDLLGISCGEAIKSVPPCRFEKLIYREQTYILDVAHNPQGLERLLERVEQRNPLVVCGMSQGKDLKASLAVILKHTHRLHLISGSHPRLASLEEMQQAAGGLAVKCYQTVSEAIQNIQLRGEPIIICGSFFIMQEARRMLGICEAVDPSDLNDFLK